VETKPVVCDLLRELDREKIVVVDHDTTVQVEDCHCLLLLVLTVVIQGTIRCGYGSVPS